MYSLGFELSLLECMSPEYRDSVLQELAINDGEAAKIRSSCKIKLPEQIHSGLQIYTEILGEEIPSERLNYTIPNDLSGSSAHSFLLMLWPHLLWVVHRRPGGDCWEVGFQNQTVIEIENFDPSMVRIGLWTRRALQALSDEFNVRDGWDERISICFVFGQEHYEGTFSFGLLDRWSRIG